MLAKIMDLDFVALLGTLEEPSRRSRNYAYDSTRKMQEYVSGKVEEANDYWKDNEDDLSKNKHRELQEWWDDAIAQLESDIRQRIDELHDFLEDSNNDNSDIESEIDYSFETDIETLADSFYTDFEAEVDARI